MQDQVAASERRDNKIMQHPGVIAAITAIRARNKYKFRRLIDSTRLTMSQRINILKNTLTNIIDYYFVFDTWLELPFTEFSHASLSKDKLFQCIYFRPSCDIAVDHISYRIYCYGQKAIIFNEPRLRYFNKYNIIKWKYNAQWNDVTKLNERIALYAISYLWSEFFSPPYFSPIDIAQSMHRLKLYQVLISRSQELLYEINNR